MSILKVEIGAPVTMTVKDAESVQGQFGPQIKFTSTTGDVLFVKEDSARRQLDRIGMTDDSIVGATLLFEKVSKNNKTYLNINPAGPARTNGSGAKQAAGGSGAGARGGNGANAQGASPRPLAPLYNNCLLAARGIVTQHLKNATAADVLAATATLFIQFVKDRQTTLYGEDDEFPPALEDGPDSLPF